MRSLCRKYGPAALALLLMPACLGLPGCQIGRSFFQMSSNAPVPFFGMDLLPKRKTASPTDGVSRFQNEGVSQPDAPVEKQNASAPPVATKSWGTLLNRSPKSETLALPTTTISESDAAPSGAPVERFR